MINKRNFLTKERAEKNIYDSISGFRIPALPVARDVGLSPEAYLSQLLHRFVVFVRALHDPTRRGAIALHVVAHPERSVLGAEVGIYLLCRVTGSYTQAVNGVNRLASQVYHLFPTESLFNYDTPVPLSEEELRHVTFQSIADNQLQVVELRKFEDYLRDSTGIDNYFREDGFLTYKYIPHPFWADIRLDPWLTLIETLAGLSKPAMISISLEPTVLTEKEAVATLAQIFRLIVEEGTRRRELLNLAAQISRGRIEERTFLQTMAQAQAFRAQGLTDYLVAWARRGAYVYNQMLAWQDQLFLMRVSLAAQGPIPEALVQSVRAALSSPIPGIQNAALGWVRPAVVRPENEKERNDAQQNVRWVNHVDWGRSEAPSELRRLRHIVTAQEAVGLFHLPVMPQSGQTTALSTADVPFVIPPEVVSTRRFRPQDGPLISFGYLYQRERCLSPDLVGEEYALDFKLRLADLEKPSLLVGAPGSGKSNLALYLLIQLWRDHRVPFLVLDPSTGHEYRYLYAEPALRDDLIVYTLGDEEGLPFRFNPFEVPPGVTVRGHITRLLSCFKAAYEMWDPLPAIYEAALARVYTQAPYGWLLDEKGGSGRPSPCLADFAQAVVDELEENVLPDYGHGTEAAGILTGASKIRVNGILNSLGHVLNVRQSDPEFFQKLLKRPAVIELGSLGDPSSIALVMAFLVTQLVGHIEHAYRQGKRNEHPHLLLIEEAHRLLSAETPATAGPNQGNVRGKSAEEMNTLLAEVRKFRQGIMVLDQRPSSLVRGALDNALVNIMCRLNDREGFEHLSNVLNLSPAQQRYARTRLKPGDALMLDAASGQPVLMRAPNVVDRLREARLSPIKERQRMITNAQRVGLVPPEADLAPTNLGRMAMADSGLASEVLASVWAGIDDEIDETVVNAVKQAIKGEDWDGARQAIRVWLTRNRATVNPRLEQTVFLRIITEFIAGQHDPSTLLAAFRQTYHLG